MMSLEWVNERREDRAMPDLNGWMGTTLGTTNRKAFWTWERRLWKTYLSVCVCESECINGACVMIQAAGM